MILKNEESENKRFSFMPFLKIGKYATKYWPLVLIALLFMTITSFYDASFAPLMNKSILSSLEYYHNMITPSDLASFKVQVNLIFGLSFETTFPQFASMYLGSIIIRCGSIFGSYFLVNYLSLKIMNDLRRDSYKTIQELSFSYFDKTPTGWILSRMQNDISAVGELLSWGIMRVIWTIIEISFLLTTLFSSNVPLTLIMLATTPTIIVITPIFQHFLLKFSRLYRNAYSNFIRWFTECINGTQTIKTLNIENEVISESKDIINDMAKKKKRSLSLQAFFSPAVYITSSITIGLLLLICYPVLDEKIKISWLIIDTSIFVVFIYSVENVYKQLVEMSEIFSEFVTNQASMEKITSLIEEKPELVDSNEVIRKYGTLLKPKKEAYEPLIGDIEYKNVSFSYSNNNEVIHGLNLSIKHGTSVALVGETGSGKTTLVNLLCRFYEPTSGDILIDKVNYKSRSVGWLRSSIAYVQQNPFVFSGTYKDNIKYGNENASDDDVKEAAKLVNIHDFIMSSTEGYDTKLIYGGNTISVGQKQLISFARAIIKDPKIFILDEATSSIDVSTEKIIQNTLSKILKGRTSIIIAHRLSTIVSCDRILMLENGVIVEDGSHKELMAKRGKYFSLYMSQFKNLELSEQLETFELEQNKSH